MLKDAKIPIRSLDTFGVSGLLGEKCEIFYENLYSTRHVGRVSDLIAAKLREAGLSEIRLRTVLLFTAFEGARAKMLETEQPYEDPILVECGIDEEKIAIGVSFATGGTWTPALEGLEARVTSGTPSDELERQLAALCRAADSVILKVSSDGKRVELAAVMLIRRTAGTTERTLELLISRVDMDARKEAPKPQVYTELGDLDHVSLLNTQGRGGLRLVGSGDEGDAARSGTDLLRVSGGKAVGDSDSEVLGRFSADSSDGPNQDLIRIKGGNGGEEEDGDSASSVAHLAHIRELEARIAELEQHGPPASGGPGFSLKKMWPFKKSAATEAPEDQSESLAPAVASESPAAGVTQPDPAAPETRIAAERPPAADPTPDSAEEGDPEAERAIQEALAKAEAESEASPAETNSENPDDPETPTDQPKLRDPQEIISEAKMTIVDTEIHAKRLADEINEGDFDRVVQRAKKELPDIKKLVPNEAAQRWIGSFMDSLISEKARLYEMSLALNANLRKKELDFKIQEQKLLAELRARDTIVRKNGVALTHARDKLAKAGLQMEKIKAGAAASKDDAQFKQRYNMAQKLMAASKKDNADLLAKIMDLKGQLSKNRGPSPAEFMALKSKNERAMKQIEELKRANQTYMERLNANKSPSPATAAASAAESAKARGPTGPAAEEMRKKLDLATRNAAKVQATADQLTLKVEEQDKEVARLKRELIRAQTDLRRKNAISGGSSGGTGAPPTAA